MERKGQPNVHLLADGLGFVEGPVALPNGDVLCVDLRNSCVWRLRDGEKPVKSITSPGSLNVAAIGPDGRLFVCNNGGLDWAVGTAINVPLGRSANYVGASIQAIDLAGGGVETLYTECDGVPVEAPNDLVFDRAGGFYFTDHASSFPTYRQHGGLYYALPDGSFIERIAYPLNHPNGVALSPDETRLYVGDSLTGNLWYWDIVAPGKVRPGPHFGTATFLSRLPGVRLFDSIAVDSEGNIAGAVLDPVEGQIVVIRPDGDIARWISLPSPDPFVTNICFGGPGLRTAYVTAGGLGRVYTFDWHCAGLPPNFSGLSANQFV